MSSTMPAIYSKPLYPGNEVENGKRPYDNIEYTPYVVQFENPLIVRIDPLSLLIDSTLFTARIKVGIIHRGFEIYASGIGEPIYKDLTTITASTGDLPGSLYEEPEYSTYENSAIAWINSLQDSFKKSTIRTVIDAIDDLTCQLHMDITGRRNLYDKYYNPNSSILSNNIDWNVWDAGLLDKLHHLDPIGELRMWGQGFDIGPDKQVVQDPNGAPGQTIYQSEFDYSAQADKVKIDGRCNEFTINDSILGRFWYTDTPLDGLNCNISIPCSDVNIDSYVRDTGKEIRNESIKDNDFHELNTATGVIARATYIAEKNILKKMLNYLTVNDDESKAIADELWDFDNNKSILSTVSNDRLVQDGLSIGYIAKTSMDRMWVGDDPDDWDPWIGGGSVGELLKDVKRYTYFMRQAFIGVDGTDGVWCKTASGDWFI